MLAMLLTLLVAATPEEEADTIVVCPQEYLGALQPWLQLRTDQGHKFAWLANTASADELRGAIRDTAKSGKLRNVVLIGDALPARTQNAALRDRCIPTHFAKAKVNVHWGSEPEIATDNWYADLDDDRIPELAIGRITADSKEDLAIIVKKIVDYENNPNHGTWRRRVNFVAGVGGFGALADSVLEMTTKKFLTEGIPSSYQMSMTYGSWRSPFCPDPRKFHQVTLDRLNEGCLFWVYIGHGQKTYLDKVRVPGRHFHILDNDDTDKLQAQNGLPIAIFLACYTGAFDFPQDCLAEEMLRAEGGPVASLSGSRVTMPYAMAVMATSMLDEYFVNRRGTLGEVMLHAKRKLAEQRDDEQPLDAGELDNRRLLDSLAAALSPSKDLLNEERLEHVELFNLIGDPLLRLRRAEDFELTAAKAVRAGETLEVTGSCALAGQCTIELVCRRDRTKSMPATRSTFDPTYQALAKYDDVYLQANDRTWAAFSADFEGGDFRAELPIPTDAFGPCHVRIHLAGKDNCALGATDVFVRPVATAAKPSR